VARILALDVGDKRIGLALSDPTEMLASPLAIIQRMTDDQSIIEILQFIKERDVRQIIAGLPCAPDGGIGFQAGKVQSFIKSLSEKTAVPILYQNERYSTNIAVRLKKEAGGKKTNKKTRYDAMAAAVFLQDYLDEHGRHTENNELIQQDE